STHAIPDLLEVIRQVEMYRLRIIDQAELALSIWQAYYEKENPERALSEEEATTMDQIARPERNWREVYLKVVDMFVGLVCHHYFLFQTSTLTNTHQKDLYCVFVSKDWSLSEFMVRLFEYSPSSFRSIQGYQPSPLKFVKFLSEEEQKSVTRRCQKTLKRVSN